MPDHSNNENSFQPGIAKIEVPSPCRALCKLNSKKVCEGCFRTSSDISFWVTMDNEQKREAVELAKKREAEFLKTGEYNR